MRCIRTRSMVVGISLAVGAVSLAGCEAVAVPFLLLRQHKVKAAHKPEPGTLAVLAEAAPGLPATDPRVRAFTDQLAATATGHLETNLTPLKLRSDGSARKGNGFVEPGRVVAERERDREAFAGLPLDAVTRQLGADRLIFVEVSQLRLPDAADTGMTGALFTPSAAGGVRVVDREGRRVFPVDDSGDAGGFLGGGSGLLGGDSGHPFAVELRPRRVGEDALDPATLRRDLADAAGLAVARLFYDWTGPRPGDAVYEERRRVEGKPLPGDQR